MSGRKPFTTGDVVPFSGEARYLRPPDNLSEAARRHFTDLVTTVPHGHFVPSDLPLLSRWAELCDVCEQSERAMQEPGGVVGADGKLSPWFKVHTTAVKSLNGLALRLRLGPQARRLKQSKKTVSPVSYYERMRLQEEWDGS
jgi:phage terminase small subunit